MPFVAIGAAAVAVALATIAAVRTRDGGATQADTVPDQIERWTAAWHSARACLVGTPQVSSSLDDALVAHDLVRPALESCSRNIVDLRGASPDGPAWVDVHRQIGALAEAYTRHRVIADAGMDDELEDLLASAIATIDYGVARRRSDARVATAELPAPIALPTLDAAPLYYQGERLPLVDIQDRRLVIRDPDSGEWATVWFLDDTPRVEAGAIQGGNVWAPDGTWKISTVDRGDARTLFSDPPQKRLASGTVDELVALAALGRDATRFALYEDDSARYLMRSTDAGRSWHRTTLPGEYGLVHAVAGNGGRLDLGYWDDDGVYVLSVSAAQNATGRLPAAIRVSTGEALSHCATGGLWLVLGEGDEAVLRRADSPEIARFRKIPTLRACSAEHALIAIDEVERLCSTTECRIIPTARDAGAAFVGEILYRHAIHAEIVAIWRDFAEPTYARAPSGRSIHGIIERADAGVVVLTDDDEMIELAPLPP